MRFAIIAVLVVLAFAGALIGAMAATGNLNQAAIMRLLGREPAPDTAPAVEGPDELAPLAQRLKEESERLKARAAELDEREARLEQRERQLEETLARIEEIQAQLAADLDRVDAERQARVRELAESIENMTEEQAAQTLQTMEPADVAEILRQVKARKRGAVLDVMDNDRRRAIFELMQERKY